MKTKLLAIALFSGGSLSAQVSIGVTIGPPPPPHIVRVQPVSPGPDYSRIEGYWYPVGNHYKWHNAYWTRPPYGGAHWVAPRYDGERFFEGRWEGERGQVGHSHRWDRGRDRDYRRDGESNHDEHGDRGRR